MNLIDLLHHPITACLQSLRRQPHGATARTIDDRPRIECLESRIAPANLLVAVSGHTLNITGDADANSVTIDADGGDPTVLHISSSTDPINTGMAPFVTPSGITSISIKLLGGDDTVTFSNTVHIDLKGSLAIDGGDGANTVNTTDLKVEKSFSITNGKNTTGRDTNTLTNLFVGGSLTIKNGDGDTETTIGRNSAATATDISSILGSLSVTNGSGLDFNTLTDTNVGKNVTFTNGHADANEIAGLVIIKNIYNTTAHSVIGGNLSVKYLDGGITPTGGGTGPNYDGLFDTTVLGNVSYDHGTGSFPANVVIDGSAIPDPVFIRGSLTIKATGTQTVFASNISFKNTGLIVGKNLTITTGGDSDTLNLNKLQVGGATRLALGDGANTVRIDDSTFLGAFGLTTGKDVDTVKIETLASTSRATIFEKAVMIKLGAGADTITREGTNDANQAIVGYSSFFIHTGGNPGEVTTANLSQEFFPLGGGVVIGV